MIDQTIHKWVVYAQQKLGLSSLDAIYVRNRMLEILGLDNYTETVVDEAEIARYEVPDCLLREMRTYLLEEKKLTVSECERMLTRLMGLITPRPSEVAERFYALEKVNSQDALMELYRLEIANNYIQKTAVDKNLYWRAEFPNNFLEITINLSKPEKKNADIAKLIGQKDINYPKCLLCEENLGYAGHDRHPARQNIRIIPLTLGDEPWFLQFSPYVYYEQHCIVVSCVHEPMMIGRRSFRCLLDFVDRFPSYFIGSNADLPIVGGSILNHEHFQGGAHLMPIMYAKSRETFTLPSYDNCPIDVLDWYNTTLCLHSKDRDALLDCAEKILLCWRQYEDRAIDLIPFSDRQHSTITPIVRKVDDEYLMYMILRNNRCNEQYPDGIFHAHPEYHNIKSEGIGLIEAMGMFILPARLDRQMHELTALLSHHEIDLDRYYREYPDLEIHRSMMDDLIAHFGRDLDNDQAFHVIQERINEVCRSILENVAVFKRDPLGEKHWQKFIAHLQNS